MSIPFHRRTRLDQEEAFIVKALASDHLKGDGQFTKQCQAWLEQWVGCAKALLTPSGTAALELACLLLDLRPGDEVILPSFTFSSCANAIILRGAVPVFVDVQAKDLNLASDLLEQARSSRTRAVMPVHYGGVVCDMDRIMTFAKKYELAVIEDAAQAIGATYKGQPAGSFGDGAAFSFHSTKNLTAGEGGAFVANRDDWAARAVIVREKGTNRQQFLAGLVDKYTWVDQGSSFLPSELQSALLHCQLEACNDISAKMVALWEYYHNSLEELELQGFITRLKPDKCCQHNGHLYAVLLNDDVDRSKVIHALRKQGVETTFHFVPLHSSPAGERFGKTASDMTNTDRAGSQLLRLPIFYGMDFHEVDEVVECFKKQLIS